MFIKFFVNLHRKKANNYIIMKAVVKGNTTNVRIIATFGSETQT